MSESSCSAFGVAQFGHFDHFRRLMLGDDHLTDPFAGFDGLRLAGEVDKDDAYLSAVVRVDCARGVENG